MKEEDSQQRYIDFGEMYKELSENRIKLRKRFWGDFGNRIELFEKIVFDLSPKDFEYFICEIAQIYQIDAETTDEYKDWKGVDITAKLGGKVYGYQCKQWSSPYLGIKDARKICRKLKKAQKEYGFYEVGLITTNKLSKASQEFLQKEKIPFYSGIDIIRGAMKMHLEEETVWESLIKKIRDKRIKSILDKRQKNRHIHYERDANHEIISCRVHEIAKHTTSYRKDDLEFDFHYDELWKFSQFKYWI